MVKITYDENNAEQRKLVEDYFWFEYYLKVIEFDILMNKDLTQQIYTATKGVSKDLSYFEIEQMEVSIMNTLKSFMSMIELSRFVDIFNSNILNNDGYKDTTINILSYIDLYGIKFFKNRYKKLLIRKFGDKN